MKRLLLAALALLALAPSADAQVTDHGSRIALKGVKKIFVDAGKYGKERERILDVLDKNEKKIPGVEVVASARDAEVILYFNVYTTSDWRYDQNRESGVRPSGTTITSVPRHHNVATVTGSVVVMEKFSGGRTLITYDSSKGPITDHPAVQFAKAFIKAWEKANK